MKLKRFTENFMLKRSVVMRFLISYILVFLIPMIGSSIAQPFIMKSIEDEVNNSNILLMDNLKMSVDKTLGNISKTSIQIKLMPELNRIVDSATSEIDYTVVADVMKSLSSIRLTNDVIEDIYLYLKDQDIIIDYTGTYQKRTYYNTIYVSDSLSYEEWIKELEEDRGETARVRQVKKGEARIGNNIECIFPSSFGTNEENGAVLVIRLNETLFGNALKQLTESRNSEGFVIDDQGQVLISTAEEAGYALSYDSLPGETGNTEITIAGEKYVFSYTSSEERPWKYVVVTPVSVYTSRLRFIRQIQFWWILLSCLVGIYTIYLFSKYNSKGIKEISSLILKKMGMAGKKKEADEVSVIKRYIQDSIQKQQNLEREMEKHGQLMENKCLSEIVHGELTATGYQKPEVQNILKRIQGDCYIIALYHIEDYGNIFFEASDELEDEEKLGYTQFIIQNVVTELINGKFKGCMFIADQNIVCLIGVPKEEEGRAIPEIKQLLLTAEQFICKEFNIMTTVSLGGKAHHYSEIEQSYRQAHEAMAYRMLLGKGGVIPFEEVCHARESYTFTFEEEQHLMNYIKSGDKEKALSLINRLYQENFAQGLMSVRLAECFMIDLSSTIIKAMSQVEHGYEDENIMKEMLNQDTVEEMREHLTMKVSWFCDRLQENRKDSYDVLVERLKAFLKENYADQNLNISVISEYFHLSGAYLSKIFKTNTGEGLLDYLHKLRIEEGKQLLRAGENIVTVAEKVGYINSNGFIRLFKKYEGITPGQYKKSVE